MKRIPVSSSNVQSIGYDSDSSILEVEFTNGAIYQYFGVPQDVYDGLMDAASKGTYLHRHVKQAYSFVKL